MQKQQLLVSCKPAIDNDVNLFDVTKQLAALFGQHAVVTKRLQELYEDPATAKPTSEEIWHNLENQVAVLRLEMESFKQTFAFETQEETSFNFNCDTSLDFS